ncbi:MAG: RNA polymerase sigma factor [Dehalococcoidia bacterium]
MTNDSDLLKEADITEKLILAAQKGDMDAFGSLYDMYLPRIYRYCIARVRNAAESEDLSEEIFIKALTNLHKFNWNNALGGTNPFIAWLFRIAHNHVISFTRRLSNKTPTTELGEWIPDQTLSPSQQVESQISIDEVFIFVQKLPNAQRDVIMMRFSAGLSIAETAAALDKNESNIKVLQHKGVNALKKMMQDEQDNEASEESVS